MKKTQIIVTLLPFLFSCKETVSKEQFKDYAIFGDTITTEKVITASEMTEKYKNLKEGDTLQIKFTSKINSVCKQKGCWMNMALNNDKEAFVKFKDYGFFVPKNADGNEAIVSGKAFLSIETVEEQKHYAADAGESKENIDKITSPKATYSFLADGVLIKK